MSWVIIEKTKDGLKIEAEGEDAKETMFLLRKTIDEYSKHEELFNYDKEE